MLWMSSFWCLFNFAIQLHPSDYELNFPKSILRLFDVWFSTSRNWIPLVVTGTWFSAQLATLVNAGSGNLNRDWTRWGQQSQANESRDTEHLPLASADNGDGSVPGTLRLTDLWNKTCLGARGGFLEGGETFRHRSGIFSLLTALHFIYPVLGMIWLSHFVPCLQWSRGKIFSEHISVPWNG